MMIGAGQTVLQGKMQDYEYLRIETEARRRLLRRSLSGDRKEASFRLASTATDDKDTIFTFANTADAFPGATHLSPRQRGLAVRDDRGQDERQPTGRSSIRCAASIARPAS